MICLVIVRVRPPVYQHRCNGCSLGAGQRLRRLGRVLTPALSLCCVGQAAELVGGCGHDLPGEGARRLGHDLPPAFRYAASVGQRSWWTAAGMICLVKERDALPAYQHRGNGCSLVLDGGCAAWAAI